MNSKNHWKQLVLSSIKAYGLDNSTYTIKYTDQLTK